MEESHRECLCEEGDFRVEKSTPLKLKPGGIEFANQNLDNEFASPTPQKINQPPLRINIKFKEDQLQLPLQPRYKTLVQLFHGLTCSLRLLSLRKKSPAFHNISTQVQLLTQREFSYRHLAQMKYILPEAIQIDKILIHDKKTLCMKPDMKIGLLFDIIEGHHEQSDFTALHQVFALRLINYSTMHPEAGDIPEGMLPHPFNESEQTAFGDKAGNITEAGFPEPVSQRSQTIAPEQLLTNTSVENLPISVKSELLEKSSHLHPSFSRHFSQKFFDSRKGNTQLLASPLPLSSAPSDILNNEAIKITYHENNTVTKSLRTTEVPGLCSEFDCGTNLEIKSEQLEESPGTYSKSTVIDPLPDQPFNPQFSIDASTSASPLCKSSSYADGLMIETPAQSIPKRAMPSCDDKHNAMTSQKQTSSDMPAKRSLDFSKDDKYMSGCYELHDNDTENLDGSSLLQKVHKSVGCPSEDHQVNLSDIMHQQEPVYLPDLISLIHRIFQSVNYSPITKEELVHKIIINSFDFVERAEVEEQIEILEKLVPEWFFRKLAPCGDVLYNIKKMSDLESVQAKVNI